MIKIINSTELLEKLNNLLISYNSFINEVIAKGTEEFYKKFYISKRGGGYRLIEAPENDTLKALQKKINYILSKELIFSDCVTGFVKKRSIKTNAQIHLGAAVIINIDLIDFFNSIKKDFIYSTLISHPFNFPEKLSNILSVIATKKDYLPQGSPLSPMLSNIVANKLDRSLSEFCVRKNIKYSRYADDMSFSVMKGRIEEEELTKIRLEIEKSGFQINEKKYKIKRKTQCLAVTGIIVNNKLNVRRIYIKNIKAALHNWDMAGTKKRINLNSLRGKIEYVGMVRGKDDYIYNKFLSKFNDLKNTSEKSLSTSKNNAITTSPDEFDKILYGESTKFSVEDFGKLPDGDTTKFSEEDLDKLLGRF